MVTVKKQKSNWHPAAVLTDKKEQVSILNSKQTIVQENLWNGFCLGMYMSVTVLPSCSIEVLAAHTLFRNFNPLSVGI